jgi:hypothetical protein
MLRVELESDDFDKNGGFVKIGAVAMAIAKANGATNLLNVERKIFPRINHAVQMGLLIPLDSETLNPLSKSDYGNGIVSFAELAEWGGTTHPGFDFLPKIYPPAPSGAPEKNVPPAPPAPVVTAATLQDEATDPDPNDGHIATLFNPVRAPQLEAMFPDDGKWAGYTERADRNGLKDAAKDGRAMFNPYRAAVWWLATGPKDWKWERCLRVLANNLPVRSIDSKHLLTGYDE